MASVAQTVDAAPSAALAAMIQQAVDAAFARHFGSADTLPARKKWAPADLPEPDALLTRPGLAMALNMVGYPISVATLQTKATRGGGPPMRKWGGKVLYQWSEALAWAESGMSKPRRSTSEPVQPSA